MILLPASMSFKALNKVLVITLLAVTVIGIGASSLWVNKINDLNANWQAHEQGVARKSVFLNLMRGSLGYGGMIHNLKNYVLRGDAHQLIEFQKSLFEIKVSISGYRAIEHSEQEKTSLRDLEAMLEYYQRAATVAESLVLKGIDPRDLDQKIIVNDKPAFAALRSLDNAVVSLRQKNQRGITEQTAELKLLVSYSAAGFSLFLILLTIISGWISRYRLVLPLERLVAAFESIDPNATQKVRLPIRSPKGKNELDLLAGAGNRFLEALDIHLAERKQAEKALAAAKGEAETANRAKSEFLAAMSHDLRTPLNAILGFADILSHQYFGPIDDKYREYAEDIHSSGEHLLTLVNDILDLSTIEAGKQSLFKENLSTEEIIRECEKIVEGKAHSNGIDLVTEIPMGLPPLYADKRAAKQILLNLLANSVKFTPKGGKITVSAAASKRDMILKVDDTGLGIAEEVLPKLTEPFTRADTDPYLAEQGWGLGLTITKSLIELHDGTLDIKSKVGKGTTVTVTLPNVAP